MRKSLQKISKALLAGVFVFGLVVAPMSANEGVTIAHAGNGSINGTSRAGSSDANDAIGSDLDLEFKDNGKGGVTLDGESTKGSVSRALNKAINFIKWLTMAGTLLLLGVFVVNLLKLGSAGTNVQARAAAQQGLVWSGIAAAVLAISSTVFFFLNSVLR